MFSGIGGEGIGSGTCGTNAADIAAAALDHWVRRERLKLLLG
jgi:hypothetical protein